MPEGPVAVDSGPRAFALGLAPAYSDNVDKMVFEFPDAQSRNLAGRALRSAGYVCFASGPKVREQACLLTVDEQLVERRSAVTRLVRDTAPVGQLQ